MEKFYCIETNWCKLPYIIDKESYYTRIEEVCCCICRTKISRSFYFVVELTSKIYYNGDITDQTTSQIRDKVIGSVQSYLDTSDTEKFNGKFRYSKMVGVIDDADKSINSNLTSITMRKDFYPSLNSTFYYELCFQNAFDEDCDDPILSSTGFRVTEYPNFDVYVEDRNKKIVPI